MEKEAEKDNEIERGWGCDMKKETEKEAERWTPHSGTDPGEGERGLGPPLGPKIFFFSM